MFFIISKQLSGPPKPASASATMGAYQSRVAPEVFFFSVSKIDSGF